MYDTRFQRVNHEADAEVYIYLTTDEKMFGKKIVKPKHDKFLVEIWIKMNEREGERER